MTNNTIFFAGKPEGSRPHDKPRNRWEDNIKMHITKIVYKIVNQVHLVSILRKKRNFVCVCFMYIITGYYHYSTTKRLNLFRSYKHSLNLIME